MKEATQYVRDRMKEERLIMLPPEYRRLVEAACTKWSYKPYWTYHEVTFLSLGYDPENVEEPSDDPVVVIEKRISIGKELKAAMDVLARYMAMGELPYTTVPKVHDITGEVFDDIVYLPVAFTKWAMLNLPSFPEKLYHAVKSKNFEDFTTFMPPRKPRQEKQGGTTSANAVGLEPKTMISKRWAPQREMEGKAEQFTVEALAAGCNCSHADLAEYLHNETFDDAGNAIFYHRKIELQSMRNLLVKVVRNVFRDRAPNRIVGGPLYLKANEPCPIHSK